MTNKNKQQVATIDSPKPVAKFFYKGSHSHPVRRTVVLTEIGEESISGYEIREGSKTRDIKNAPIKSYSKSQIAKAKDLDKRVSFAKNSKPNTSTLRRFAKIEA